MASSLINSVVYGSNCCIITVENTLTSLGSPSDGGKRRFEKDKITICLELLKIVRPVFPGYTHCTFLEFMKNSHDNFIKKSFSEGAGVGDKLVISVALKEFEDHIDFEFGDNGTGFITRGKGITFEYDKTKDMTIKDHRTGMQSGNGDALSNHINFSKIQYGGKVTIRNHSKRDGCTIKTKLPKEKVGSLKLPELQDILPETSGSKEE